MNDIDHEGWHQVHAQLLKSVADAQARLLAGINEVSDRLPTKLFAELASVDQALVDIKARLEAITGRLEVLSKDYSSLGAIFNQLRDGQTLAHKDLQAGIMSLRGKLDAIGTVLAELLQAKSSASLPKSYRTQPKAKRHR